VFFIDNLLVRIHFIIVMIRWTGLAPISPSCSLFPPLDCFEGGISDPPPDDLSRLARNVSGNRLGREEVSAGNAFLKVREIPKFRLCLIPKFRLATLGRIRGGGANLRPPQNTFSPSEKARHSLNFGMKV